MRDFKASLAVRSTFDIYLVDTVAAEGVDEATPMSALVTSVPPRKSAKSVENAGLVVPALPRVGIATFPSSSSF